MLTTAIGTAAGILTMFNMFPQYLKVMKTKQTRDLSRATFTSLTCSSCLWVTYGVLRHDNIIIIANSLVFFFVISILYMKIKHG